jgi:hypothetical protein
LHAQEDVRLKLDSTEFLIGDQTDLTISYLGKQDPKSFDILQETIDTLSQLELLNVGPLIRNRNGELIYIEQKLKVAFFDTGTIWIPAIPVVLDLESGLDTLETNEVPIRVLSPQQDSLSMAPIKDIIREPWHITDAWPYFLGLLIAVLLYLSFKKRKRKKAAALLRQQEEVLVVKSPYELAIEAINNLPQYDLKIPDEVKEHFASLSIILRTYIEGQFNIPAAESTTYEIGIDLNKKEIPAEMIDKTLHILNNVDLVKFAKIKPSQEEIEVIKPNVIERIEVLNDWDESRKRELQTPEDSSTNK